MDSLNIKNYNFNLFPCKANLKGTLNLNCVILMIKKKRQAISFFIDFFLVKLNFHKIISRHSICFLNHTGAWVTINNAIPLHFYLVFCFKI